MIGLVLRLKDSKERTTGVANFVRIIHMAVEKAVKGMIEQGWKNDCIYCCCGQFHREKGVGEWGEFTGGKRLL